MTKDEDFKGTYISSAPRFKQGLPFSFLFFFFLFPIIVMVVLCSSRFVVMAFIGRLLDPVRIML